MQPIRKINAELAIAGQISPEQVIQLAQDGFQTVLNLRCPEEAAFPLEELKLVESLGLHDVNHPVEMDAITDEAATRVLQAVQSLPKPLLVHCDNAIRSAAIALMYIATRQGSTLEQAFKQARQLGLFSPLTQV